MRIGFISDTHGNLYWTKKALDILGECDLILHMGDVLYHGPRNPLTEDYRPSELAEFLKGREDIIYVRGNCDSDVDETVTGQDISEPFRLIEAGGLKIYMTHGYLEKEEYRESDAKSLGANVLVTGHSHIKVLEEKDNLVILNPGSTTLPKDGSHSAAYYEDGVFYLVDIEKGKILKEINYKNTASQ